MTMEGRKESKRKLEVYEVKMIDKVSFTLGVFCICSTEWLALRQAQWFPLYYLTIMTCLLAVRVVTFTRKKYQLFMLGGYHLAKPLILHSYIFIFRFLLLHELVVGGSDVPLPVQHYLVQSKSILNTLPLLLAP